MANGIVNQPWVANVGVNLEGENLVFDQTTVTRVAMRGDESLRVFVNLATADTSDILRFARRWGALKLCRHERPCWYGPGQHSAQAALDAAVRHGAAEILPEWEWACPPTYRESVTSWRRVARQLGSALRIQRRLKANHTVPSPIEWTALNMVATPGVPAPDQAFRKKWSADLAIARLPSSSFVVSHDGGEGGRILTSLEEPDGRWFLLMTDWAVEYCRLHSREVVEHQRGVISSVVTSWLEDAGLHAALEWSNTDLPALRYTLPQSGAHLYANLLFQLRLALSEVRISMTCDGCGDEYEREKRVPRPGQRNFCDNCSENKTPEKKANEARRQRERERRQQPRARRQTPGGRR